MRAKLARLIRDSLVFGKLRVARMADALAKKEGVAEKKKERRRRTVAGPHMAAEEGKGKKRGGVQAVRSRSDGPR